MRTKHKLDRILDLLKRPAYVELLLCIASGRNYATAIARTLGKSQPTVTEQLKELENLELIRPVKRDKSKKYEVNWDLLLKIFYKIVDETIELRKEFLLKRERIKIRELGLRNLIPPRLLKSFLKEYFYTLIDLGGKRKGFDEIIFSFFNALDNLEEKEWKKLVRKFNINEEALSTLAHIISFEISAIEQVALINLAR